MYVKPKLNVRAIKSFNENQNLLIDISEDRLYNTDELTLLK